MTNQLTLQPFILVKIVLWAAVVITATMLLRRRKVDSRVRTVFLVSGTLVFGFAFGFLIPGGKNPNPVAMVRTFFTSLLVKGQLSVLITGMLAALLLMSFVSNKALCGWGCQLGLLQDLLHRAKLPKWKPKFWFSNSIRVGIFIALITGLVVGLLDIIGLIDPFQIFSFQFTLAIGIFSGILLITSVFVYRPWCRFICPFGLISWLVEQMSLFRPRIDRQKCRECNLCVNACPSGAMDDFFKGKRIHADCFACGACIEACPCDDTLGWWSRSQLVSKIIKRGDIHDPEKTE